MVPAEQSGHRPIRGTSKEVCALTDGVCVHALRAPVSVVSWNSEVVTRNQSGPVFVSGHATQHMQSQNGDRASDDFETAGNRMKAIVSAWLCQRLL